MAPRGECNCARWGMFRRRVPDRLIDDAGDAAGSKRAKKCGARTRTGKRAPQVNDPKAGSRLDRSQWRRYRGNLKPVRRFQTFALTRVG